MDFERLSNIKNNIEKMSKKHQIDILRIFKNSSNVILNENSNGIFINLSELDISILENYGANHIYDAYEAAALGVTKDLISKHNEKS